MIAFEVLVNGEKLCIAGVGDKGILHVIVDGPRLPSVVVGGLQGEQHVRWLKHGSEKGALQVGDEVTVRVVEADAVDEPVERSVSQTRAEREAKVRDHLEKARVLLPESVDLQNYYARLAENHLMGAMDVLEVLGDSSAVPAEFWKALSGAAHQQTAYEDRDRYSKKWQDGRAVRIGMSQVTPSSASMRTEL